MWAETWTWTASSGALGSGIGSGTITANDISWTYKRTLVSGTSYTGWTSNCIQLGKNGGVENLTLSTSDIPGTITKVSVECSSYNNAHKVSISVGGTTYLSSTATAKWTTVSAKEGTGTSSGEIVISFTGGSRALYIKSITVEYSTGSGSDPAPVPVPVTGVTLDKSTLELEADETATLTATIAPNNASNKGVTWTSSDDDVATVENGVVKAVAVGTARITVTTKDGSYTATCDVTVTAAPVATALLDFTTNDWGISVSPDKTIDATDFTSGGYTVTIEGSSDNGYYFDNDNIMIGKAGASLTLPAFPFNVKKIKVYGTDAASGSVKFNIFVNETPVSTEVTSSKKTQEFIINEENQAAGNRYIIKVTNANNMRISKIEVFGYVPVTIGSAGFATLFTPAALDFSGVAGLTAYTAAKEGDVVRLTKVNDVQANTGVVLEGTAGTYSIPAIATSSTAKGELTGNATEATAWNAESGYTYYVLASTGSGVEFRPVNKGEIAAGKAFLKVAGNLVHAFNVVFGDETGISEVVRDGEKESAIFDLSGRRVAKPAKGLYIVNGKKILVK